MRCGFATSGNPSTTSVARALATFDARLARDPATRAPADDAVPRALATWRPLGDRGTFAADVRGDPARVHLHATLAYGPSPCLTVPCHSVLDLNAIDLNLLPKFRALYRRRSVSEAARDLHVTQSAVSNALAKMRQLFGDELFVRTAEGMEPTPAAHALARPIERALARLESGLAGAHPFDPATSARTFRLAMTQLAEAWLAPHLIALAHAEAPGVVVSTVKSRHRLFEDDLRDGVIDLAVGHLPDLGPPFRDAVLSEHEFVCLMRRAHPALREPLTERALLACAFVEVVEHGAIYDRLSRAVLRAAGRDATRVRTSNALALPYTLAAADLVAVVPLWFAARNARAFDLQAVRLPREAASGTMRLFWHDDEREDAGAAWMRDAVARAAARADAASATEPAAVMTPITDADG